MSDGELLSITTGSGAPLAFLVCLRLASPCDVLILENLVLIFLQSLLLLGDVLLLSGKKMEDFGADWDLASAIRVL